MLQSYKVENIAYLGQGLPPALWQRLCKLMKTLLGVQTMLKAIDAGSRF